MFSTPRSEFESHSYSLAWSASFSVPAVIVAPEMDLIWINRTGETLLNGADDFCLVDGRLTCADPTLRAEFQKFVSGALQQPGVWVCGAVTPVRMLVRGDPVEPTGHKPAIGLLFYTMDVEHQHMWADFGKVFGLTRSEVQIVKRVVGGEKAQMIALEQGISLDTVRTHIRRVYGKLCVNSREELFSLISPFRVR